MADSVVKNRFQPESISIRTANAEDTYPVWEVFHAVISRGETFSLDPNISRDEALVYWFSPEADVFVAVRDGVLCGSYILKANRPGPGSHVANASFIVSPVAQGCGVGRIMAEHCLGEARRQGFRAMQFNFVVSTNATALALWKSLGFRIVGTLPGAFRHPALGFVDAYVMFKSLEASDE